MLKRFGAVGTGRYEQRRQDVKCPPVVIVMSTRDPRIHMPAVSEHTSSSHSLPCLNNIMVLTHLISKRVGRTYSETLNLR